MSRLASDRRHVATFRFFHSFGATFAHGVREALYACDFIALRASEHREDVLFLATDVAGGQLLKFVTVLILRVLMHRLLFDAWRWLNPTV